MGVLRNQVQLITYADRLAGTVAGLAELLTGPLAGLFGGVHLLPFFTPFDGVDAGFDPADHTEVDPRLGGWADVQLLARTCEVMADVIVNHVSTDSASFRDVRRLGTQSGFASMFLTFGRVFPGGASEEQLLRIYRPRPGLPFTKMRLGTDDHLVWTTFTDHQVDIDVDSVEGGRYLQSVLEALAGADVGVIRLDAVGYAVKTAGTSCFMTPQTLEFIDRITGQARALGLEVLVEVHGTYEQQQAVAARVDFVYDFALPPLVLHALTTADAGPLCRWLDIRPSNAVTVLDTHDGIGIIDVADAPGQPGLLDPRQIDALVEQVHQNSNGSSRKATGAAASNLDLYQVNCTYYDALGADDDRYLLARAIQLFTPGVPQIYYVGLLAGSNDMDLLARTGTGRDVNRHHYTAAEIAEALRRPVVRQLLALIRFRNTHPAFDGTFTYRHEPGGLTLEWADGPERATLQADLSTAAYMIRYTANGSEHVVEQAAELAYPESARTTQP